MFILLPVAVDYRASRRPLVTLWFIGACLGFYLLSIAVGAAGGREAFASFFLGLALVPSEAGIHNWFTSMFMHAGFFHLLGNMVYLYLFGACVEDLLGRGRFIAFYLAGGLAAAFLHVLLAPGGFDSPVPMVGASGAIAACMGAFVVLLRNAAVELRFIYWIFFAFGSREFHVPSWLLLSIYFAMDAFGMISSIASGESGGTAFAAHVGGFLFGAGAAMLLRPRFDEDSEPHGESQEALSSVSLREIAGPPIHLWHQNAQVGPFPANQVRQMQALGTLDPDCLYWDESGQQWRPLSEIAPAPPPSVRRVIR